MRTNSKRHPRAREGGQGQDNTKVRFLSEPTHLQIPPRSHCRHSWSRGGCDHSFSLAVSKASFTLLHLHHEEASQAGLRRAVQDSFG